MNKVSNNGTTVEYNKVEQLRQISTVRCKETTADNRMEQLQQIIGWRS